MTRSLGYEALARAAHIAQPTLGRTWRRATVAGARDATAASAERSCVVIAPHPDDETLGCGATIARKRASGTAVTVVVVADGRYAQHRSRLITPAGLAVLRAEEAVAACAALGVAAANLLQLGFEDNAVRESEDDLVHRLHELLIDVVPEEVLVVSGLDHHVDHRAVNRAAHRALARWDHLPVVGEFPVWSWIDGPWSDQDRRRPPARAAHLVGQPLRTLLRGRATTVATDGFLGAKRAALAAHATQTSSYTDEADWAVMSAEMLELFLGPEEVFLPPTWRAVGSR